MLKAEKFFSNLMEKRINHSPSYHGLLMNSKAEYRQGKVARVAIIKGLEE